MYLRRLNRLIHVWVLCLALTSSGRAQQAEIAPPPSGERRGVVIPVREMIDPLSGALLKRKILEAVDGGVDVVILEIQSPGGYTSVTLELMDVLQDVQGVETVAYIEKDAISGAALLALACDKIIMLPDARMGDAGEIVMGEDGAFRYTEAKSRSVLAQKVRDTAARTGRPPALAEKMVDKDLTVFEATHKSSGATAYFSDREWESLADSENWIRGKPIREAGQEMFFICNGTRAVELGMANQTVQNRDELARVLDLRPPIPRMERTWIDTLVFLLNTNAVTFLLIVIGLVALTIELGSPGLGIGGLASLLCFSLFFWSRFLGGTSGWLEVVLFLVGLAFVAAELFLIPGFGVAGVGGITLIVGALIMASRRFMIPENREQLTALGFDALTVVGAFLGFLVAIVLLSNYIGEIPALSRLTLKPPVLLDSAASLVGSGEAVTLPGWQQIDVGAIGQAISPLRPSGKTQFGNFTVDVVTDGEFVESGSTVQVITKQGTRVVVRRA
jgi:membrane-bound serine protease (ClpP class)